MIHMTKKEVVKFFMVCMKTDSGLIETKSFNFGIIILHRKLWKLLHSKDH